MVLQCVGNCWIYVRRFFQAWNQAHLTKHRHRRAILGLQISTDYKGKQHNSKHYMFCVQASIMNTNICDICIQKLIFTLFGKTWKRLDLETLLCSWSDTLVYVIVLLPNDLALQGPSNSWQLLAPRYQVSWLLHLLLAPDHFSLFISCINAELVIPANTLTVA